MIMVILYRNDASVRRVCQRLSYLASHTTARKMVLNSTMTSDTPRRCFKADKPSSTVIEAGILVVDVEVEEVVVDVVVDLLVVVVVVFLAVGRITAHRLNIVLI